MGFEKAIALLKEKNMTVTFAESCTGGLLAKMLTDVAGASAVFKGSIVSYANEIKHSILCVGNDTLNMYGAVSKQTAYEMANGARLLFASDIAISVTGIAGPDGGSEEKPVGLVYIGICDKNKTKTYRMKASDAHGRDGVRRAVGNEVCRLLEEWLENE